MKHHMNTINITSQRRKTGEKGKIGTGSWYRFSLRFPPRYAEGDSAVPNPQCARTTLVESTLEFCTKNPRMNTGRNHRYQKPVPILPMPTGKYRIQIEFSGHADFCQLEPHVS